MPIVGINVKVTTPVLKTWIASTVTLFPLSKSIFIYTIVPGQEEKREQKAIMQESDSTLIEPSSVTVIGVATDIGKTSSIPAKVDKKHENSVESDKSSKAKKAGPSVSKGSGKKSLAKHPKLTTDNKLEQLDKKWYERFSRMEAMLLSKTFNQPAPVFQSVVGPSTNPPPADALDNNQPFFKPQTDQPTTNQQELTKSPATVHQQPTNHPKTDNQPSSTDQHLQHTILLATLSSLIAGLSLTTNLLLPALISHKPTNRLLTISSLLTGISLMTGPVLH